MDRIRCHQGANHNPEQRRAENNIYQNDVHDLYKSFSSADRIHFFEEQRRRQNLVGDLEGEDVDVADQRREQSANEENPKDWTAEKDSNGADNDYIISIRDSNIEQAVEN